MTSSTHVAPGSAACSTLTVAVASIGRPLADRMRSRKERYGITSSTSSRQSGDTHLPLDEGAVRDHLLDEQLPPFPAEEVPPPLGQPVTRLQRSVDTGDGLDIRHPQGLAAGVDDELPHPREGVCISALAR
jgi:hypothetical protein